MPREARTLHPDREVAHAAKDSQVSEVVRGRFRVEFAQNHLVKFVEENLDLPTRLALHTARHHAGGSLRDGAPLPLEADVLDDAVFDVQVDEEVVAAGSVVAFC